jgi:1-acyl-sn-glycerol-3-phosphate acyltransferase
MSAGRPALIKTRSIPVSSSGDAWQRQSVLPSRFFGAACRTVVILLWSFLAIPIQAILLAVPGTLKVRFARFYWAIFCRLFGVRVRVVGKPCEASGRPVIFVSNHSSWLDVGVLGAQLKACFVAKEDVASWPLVNLIARLGRTVYVRRQRASTFDETQAMRQRLRAGDNLILFPEGTTSDGSRVLPFRSSFLAVTDGNPAPLVQPISIVYDRLAGLPAVRSTRPIFAYYGDMSIGPHYWRLAQCHGVRATIVLHDPVDPRDYADRKALTRALWSTVAAGAATLRQNRPPTPLPPIPKERFSTAAFA